MALTLLAAESEGGGKSFDECAARWLAGVAVERKLTISQMMEAGSTLQAAARREADNAHQVLAGLL